MSRIRTNVYRKHIETLKKASQPQPPRRTAERLYESVATPQAPVERPDISYRKYFVTWLDERGEIRDEQVRAPVKPVFERAFSAFSHGALIPTTNGPVAIEDLLPGDQVVTVDDQLSEVTWVGHMELDIHGSRAPGARPEKLYRVSNDAFGAGRPSPDLLLGESARTIYRSGRLLPYHGTIEALAPIHAMTDGYHVSEITPMGPTHVYHFCLSNHAVVRVNGLELETFHPGHASLGELAGEQRKWFMELFPHLGQIRDFGPLAYQRLGPTDLLELNPH